MCVRGNKRVHTPHMLHMLCESCSIYAGSPLHSSLASHRPQREIKQLCCSRSTMLPTDGDVEAFIDSVSEVERLVAGLKAGAISPEYVDSKIAQRSQKQLSSSSGSTPSAQHQASSGSAPTAPTTAAATADKDAADTEAARQAELARKVEELKANRQRKLRARQLYESYVQGRKQQQHSYATDYDKWELWCPSDEEDDLFNSLTPNSPEFRAMERDISKRHERMVEQRQIAERQRQLGNAAYKAGQCSEALRCYEQGLESQRHNMTLHANAAMAALKLKCYVATQEHCDKVLHLAEVLHNTPQHALCVKALQRRAAAHQGLGQHSQAVADLQAAAGIVPGDDEVAQQLKRAQALLEEHKTAKQLARLAKPDAQQEHQQEQPASSASALQQPPSCSGNGSSSSDDAATPVVKEGVAASGSSSSSNAKSAAAQGARAPSSASDVQHLRRIEQLVAVLSTANTADSSQAGKACQELTGLLQESRHRVYFRGCDGLAAVSKLVPKATDPVTQVPALQLLNLACDTDTALEQLTDQVLCAALDLVGSPDHTAAAAALDLSYSASICSAVRSRLCAQLVKPPTKQQQGVGCSPHSCRRLAALWETCCHTPAAGAAGWGDSMRAVSISLLSNCMLVPAVRAAMLPLLQQQGEQGLRDLAHLLAANNRAPGLAVKVCGLLSNMCSHPGLRAGLAACQPLVQQVLCSACSPAGRGEQPGLVLAAMGCLCNLSLEQGVVQQMLAADVDVVARLLQLAAKGPGSFAHFSSGVSAAPGSRPASSAAPKLPPRGKGKAVAAPELQQSAAAKAGAAQDACTLSARAATLLSRVAKQAEGVQQLQGQDVLGVLARTTPQCLQTVLAAPAAQRDAESMLVREAAAEWMSAAVRTMALVTAAAAGADGSICSASTAAAIIGACCSILRSPSLEDAVRGNAALVLKSFAADSRQRWHAALAKADAVEALVTAARAGKGSPSCRNAGIALAVLARAGVGGDSGCSFIERMRELRGLEVLYEYVQP